MIESLNHLPQAGGTHSALSERFTDLAPPLTARQAAIESARCLYCYDAPCMRACPTTHHRLIFREHDPDHRFNRFDKGSAKVANRAVSRWIIG